MIKNFGGEEIRYFFISANIMHESLRQNWPEEPNEDVVRDLATLYIPYFYLHSDDSDIKGLRGIETVPIVNFLKSLKMDPERIERYRNRIREEVEKRYEANEI